MSGTPETSRKNLCTFILSKSVSLKNKPAKNWYNRSCVSLSVVSKTLTKQEKQYKKSSRRKLVNRFSKLTDLELGGISSSVSG